MPDRHYVLSLGCPDSTGIVARISVFLAEAGGWISEAAYHSDPDTGWFFTRQVVRADSLPFSVDELRNRFTVVAAELGSETDWRVLDSGQRRRLVVLVSKEAHCLYDLLERSASGELPAELRAVVGNHPDIRLTGSALVDEEARARYDRWRADYVWSESTVPDSVPKAQS